VATPSPQPPAGPAPHLYTPSPAPRHNPGNLVGIALLILGFVLFMVGTPLAAVAGIVSPVVVGVVGVGLAMVGGLILGSPRLVHRRTLPPPPPIRLPLSAPGAEGRAVEIACPNCGAAPRNIDRFGVATCDYCDTRFLVR